MATPTRIYIVANAAARDAEGKELPARLVRAQNSSQALRHVAADTLSVAVAGQDDLFRLARAGVEIETAGEEG